MAGKISMSMLSPPFVEPVLQMESEPARAIKFTPETEIFEGEQQKALLNFDIKLSDEFLSRAKENH